MALLGLLCFSASLLASLVVGTRLLFLARRTRELPELAIAIAFLAGGVVGYTLVVLAAMNRIPADYTVSVGFLSSLGIQTGGLAIAFFTRRVFRPTERWAGIAFATLCAAGLVAVLGRFLDSPEVPRGPIGFWFGMAGTLGCYAWACYESLRYHAQLRRRLKLGLADPAVTHRVFLWAIGSGATTVISLFYVWLRLMGLRAFPPAVQVFLYLVSLATAIAIWLAFFPPAAYQRRFQRESVPTH